MIGPSVKIAHISRLWQVAGTGIFVLPRCWDVRRKDKQDTLDITGEKTSREAKIAWWLIEYSLILTRICDLLQDEVLFEVAMCRFVADCQDGRQSNQDFLRCLLPLNATVLYPSEGLAYRQRVVSVLLDQLKIPKEFQIRRFENRNQIRDGIKDC